MSEILNLDMDPKELDIYLSKRLGIGLYPFAVHYAYVLFAGGLTKTENFPDNQALQKLKTRLINIKREMVDIAVDFHFSTLWWDDVQFRKTLKKHPEYAEEWAARWLNIGNLFSYIDSVSFQLNSDHS